MYLNKIPNIITIMKKFIVVIVSIFLLLSSFTIILFLEKQKNGKEFVFLDLAKMAFERKNENFEEENEYTEIAEEYKVELRDVYFLATAECYYDEKLEKTNSNWFNICQRNYIQEYTPYLKEKWNKVYNSCTKQVKNRKFNSIDNCLNAKLNTEFAGFELKQRKKNYQENWKNLTDRIYIDLNSVYAQSDYISGTFKGIPKKEITIYEQTVGYYTLRTAASCNLDLQDGIKKLEYPIVKYYDKDNKFITEDNIHRYWNVHYPGGHLGITHPDELDNGDLFFDTLCSYYKNSL